MLPQLHALLENLRWRHTREHIEQLLKTAQKRKPSYSAFLLQILQQEHAAQRDRRLANRIKNCGLREYWTLETFPWHIQKQVKKREIYELAELDFIRRGESVVLIGPAGVGKSSLAGSLLLKALFNDYRGLCIKAHDLFQELGASQADRSTRRLLKRLSSLHILQIDEFGYLDPPRPDQLNNFFRLMDNRCSRKTTLITTNLGYDAWNKFLGNKPMVAALLSRLLQKCHTIPIKGVNLRHPKYGLPAHSEKPDILKRSP